MNHDFCRRFGHFSKNGFHGFPLPLPLLKSFSVFWSSGCELLAFSEHDFFPKKKTSLKAGCYQFITCQNYLAMTLGQIK